MRKSCGAVAYGAAALLAAFVGVGPAAAAKWSYEVLYQFCQLRNCADGGGPAGGVVLDADGNIWGTTAGGGAHGFGTVFEVTTAGSEVVRHDFAAGDDGGSPFAGLTIDVVGVLFGTTDTGGSTGLGTVFAVSKQGHLHVIDSLQFSQRPQAPVAVDGTGNLFGTATAGGANGQGTVFEFTNTGQEQTLYSFCTRTNCADGAVPVAGLVLDAKGNLYGTTSSGGAAGNGVVFKLAPSGKEKVLCDFQASARCPVGATPLAGLVMDKKGNLYGTTSAGGTQNLGIVFELTRHGVERVLYNFCSFSGCPDGADPAAGLVLDEKSGVLYGTTFAGGRDSAGIVFALTKKGQFSVIYDFCNTADCSDGAQPVAGLTIDANGNLYGTGKSGGAAGKGVVFELVRR